MPLYVKKYKYVSLEESESLNKYLSEPDQHELDDPFLESHHSMMMVSNCDQVSSY